MIELNSIAALLTSHDLSGVLARFFLLQLPANYFVRLTLPMLTSSGLKLGIWLTAKTVVIASRVNQSLRSRLNNL